MVWTAREEQQRNSNSTQILRRKVHTENKDATNIQNLPVIYISLCTLILKYALFKHASKNTSLAMTQHLLPI